MKPVLMILLAATLAALGVLAPAGPTEAQKWTISDNHEWCDHDWGERYCEVRETTLPADRDVIAVDGDANGGIRVTGWDRDEILLLVKVRIFRGSEESARELASEIEIITDGRAIYAKGPKQRRSRGWSVSYELKVPRSSNLSLDTVNGGIRIDDVSGDIDFEATNGGIHLSGGRTTNGGL